MTVKEEPIDLSLNISEDENCTFITSNLLEQSENFDEWLDKNGVHYIINNERITECLNNSNNPSDPLFNQFNSRTGEQNDSDAESELHKTPDAIKKESSLEHNQSLCMPEFTTLNCKSNYLEKLVDGSLYTELEVQENKIRLDFTNANGEFVYSRTYISLNEIGGQLSLPKEKVPVVSIEKISIANDLNCSMPCLSLGTTSLKLFVCPQLDCDLVYTRVTAAKLHTLMQLGHKPFKCLYPDCKWAFYTSFKLKRHQESHTNQKEFVCVFANCGRRFTNVYNLNIHVKNHERPATLPCFVKGCSMKFQTSRTREKHFKTHNISDAPFVCPEANCNRAFFLMTGLQAHAKSHSHKESEIRCDYPNCGKVFKQPCRLKEHVRGHTGQRPYVCTYDQCTWSFTSSSKLRRHQISHTNERKFHCTIDNCTKSFLRSEHLKEHTLTHIGPRTYTCEACSGKFYSLFGRSSLYLHLKKAHPEIQQNSKMLSQNHQSQEIVQLPQESNKPTADILLEQAIQSLGVPSDMILGTGLIPEESLELLGNGNFSTVNLRDLE